MIIMNTFSKYEHQHKKTLIVVCEWNSSLIETSTETIRNCRSCPGLNQRAIPLTTSKKVYIIANRSFHVHVRKRVSNQ